MNKNSRKTPVWGTLVKSKAFLPVSLFVVIVLLFGFSSRFADRPPVIEGITPEIGNPGDVLVITGSHFGDLREGGEVHIAGARPTTSSYVEWTDRRISVKIPPNAGSGMVDVSNRRGRSKGILFTNRNHIPVVIEGPAQPGQPYITETTPTKGNVGTLITIKGLNFGIERGNGKVYFTPIPIADDIRQTKDPVQKLISAREMDYDYYSWSDTEIRVFVPDGASSGNVSVLTARGMSNSIYFEVAEQTGVKILKQKRGYQIQYGVKISAINSQPGNSLYLWVPKLFTGLEQTNSELITDLKPYWDMFQGELVYRFQDIIPGESYSINQTYWFDRYAVETKITAGKVSGKYNMERKLYSIYTSPDVFVPSDNNEIEKISRSLTGRISNPYQKAQVIFRYVLRRYSPVIAPAENDVIKSIDTKEGDSYIYAMVLTALLRSSGVPARPLAGYLVYGDKLTVKHYWVEFYIDNFGWIPVDSYLADGASFGDFPEVENPESYYFGSIDNQHIIFSRGILQTNRISPEGKIVRRERSYSLQTIFEETGGNLESYHSSWQDVNIVDWW